MANDTDETQENPVIQLLEDTRALLKQGACKPGAAARDADGHACDPNSDKAQSFTLAGALARAVWNRHGDSTGVDTVHVLLGVGNLTDASIAGLSALDSDELDKRFDRALALARGEEYEEPEDEEPEGELDDGTADDETKGQAAQDAALRTGGDLTVDNPGNPAGNKIEP
jgi:hypothetical protein